MCDDVLNEMQMIDGVAAEEKCLLLAKFVFDATERRCYEYRSEKSFEKAKQDDFLLKSVLGKEAADHQMLGHCYVQIGKDE